MKKIFTAALIILSGQYAMAQNVGVGTTAPLMPLHIKTTTDTAILLAENSALLATNVNTGLYFKTGSYFTGAIKAIGTGSNTSRLGFYTYALSNQNGLKEYMSILDNGYVGIGTTTPARLLTVNGSGSFGTTDPSLSTATLYTTSQATSVAAPAIYGSGVSGGVLGLATTGNGVYGISGFAPLTLDGIGVLGESSNGQGVLGVSNKDGSASVQGISLTANVTAGSFSSNANGKALYTSGPVQISGQGAGAGKVLTSDALGNATWQTPSSGAAIGFSANVTAASTTVNQAVAYIPTAYTVHYNDGNAFSPTTGAFTAPSAGLYQFTINLAVGFATGGDPVQLVINLKINNTVNGINKSTTTVPSGKSQGVNTTANYTRLVKLNAGDVVNFETTCYVVDNTSMFMFLYGGSGLGMTTVFSGAKIY